MASRTTPAPSRNRRFLRTLQILAISVGTLLVWSATGSLLSDPTMRMEGVLSDLRNRAWTLLFGPKPEDVPSPVTVVDVDERTLQELGIYGQNYRRHHAEVVDFLSRHGAAAVVFDVLFKSSDSGRSAFAQTMDQLRSAGWPTPTDSTTRERLRQALDVSSRLERAVERSECTIVAAQLGDHLDYPNPSDWIPLANPTWQRAIWPDPVRLPDSILATLPGKNTLDNVYPGLARAAERLSLVNIEPDPDGTVRRIQLLWRYPDTSLVDSRWAPEGTAPPAAYPALSLAATLRLFGRRPDELTFLPGKWLDLGSPLRLWRDSSGDLQTSAPGLTWAMCRALRSRHQELRELEEKREGTVEVSGPVVLHRRGDGSFQLELSPPESLDDRMVRTLAALGTDTSWWEQIPSDGTPAALSEDVFVQSDVDGIRLLTMTDLESEAPRATHEALLERETLGWIQEGFGRLASRFPSLDSIPEDSRLAFTNALDVQWDRSRARLSTSFLALRGSSITDLLALEDSRIASLAPGDTLHLGTPVRIPVDSRGAALLGFPAPARWVGRRLEESWIRHVSYVDVLHGRLDPGLVAGRVFLLGSSATALADFVDAPIEARYPGVNIQALGIHQWASGDVLRLPPLWFEFLLPLLAALATSLLASVLAPAWALLAASGLALGWIVLSVVLFQFGWWIPLIGFLAPAFLGTISMGALRYFLEERKKEFLHQSFKTYLAPELINQMIESGDLPSLGGEERVITAFFSDIQAFSTFSEAIGSPSRLVDLLNEYLGSLTKILLKNHGGLDKYIGDAIVAMFGAPIRLEDHARRAVESAVAMQEMLAILRTGWQNQGEAWPEIVHHMRMRIGLNSGAAVTGNMGSTTRMSYTMMGDTVNLAARLESAAKHYGAWILAADSTVSQAGGSFLYRELDRLRVVGRTEPVTIHEVVGRAGDPRWDACLETFAKGRARYLEGDFIEARRFFQESSRLEPLRGQAGVHKTPSDVLLARSDNLLQNPPPQWDGVYTATEK